MNLEITVKFNIGDKVLVKNPHCGSYSKPEQFEAIIGGYVIHKTNRATKVYYTLEVDHKHWTSCSDYNRKKRYVASELELIK